MDIRNINTELVEITADSGYILHKIGDNDYYKIRKVAIKASDIDKYEEILIEDIPPYSYEDYKKEIIKLIREKYDQNDEFAILRKSKADNMEEYNEYNTFVEDCKIKAKENLWQRNRN